MRTLMLGLLLPVVASCDPAPDPAPALSRVGELLDSARRSSSARPNLVIYVIDALRAKQLGTYGYALPVSPEIDAFAQQSVVFEYAYAQAPWTRPAVVSIFTGRLPRAHGVLDLPDALSQNASTLAEILRDEGYATAGVVQNVNLSAKFAIDQGFEFYRQLPSDAPASSLNRPVKKWLDERDPAKPFFLYLHSMDPHAPYAPSAVFRQKFASAPGRGLSPDELKKRRSYERFRRGQGLEPKAPVPGSMYWLTALDTGLLDATDERVEQLVSLYDAEVAYNDEAFGSLLDLLHDLKIAENTWILLLADHGEEFYEHAGWQHGELWEEVIRIPFILRPPSGLSAGVREEERHARQVDVLPTVLDLFGIEAPMELDGSSLLRATAGDPPRSYTQIVQGHNVGESVVEGRWKLIRRTAPKKALALYDLDQDPEERRDVRELHPERVQRLARLLDEASRQSTRAPNISLDAELLEGLKALGYLE